MFVCDICGQIKVVYVFHPLLLWLLAGSLILNVWLVINWLERKYLEQQKR